MTNRHNGVKAVHDDIAEPCKCDDFWHDASKIIDFLRAQGWEASDFWKWK